MKEWRGYTVSNRHCPSQYENPFSLQDYYELALRLLSSFISNFSFLLLELKRRSKKQIIQSQILLFLWWGWLGSGLLLERRTDVCQTGSILVCWSHYYYWEYIQKATVVVWGRRELSSWKFMFSCSWNQLFLLILVLLCHRNKMVAKRKHNIWNQQIFDWLELHHPIWRLSNNMTTSWLELETPFVAKSKNDSSGTQQWWLHKAAEQNKVY